MRFCPEDANEGVTTSTTSGGERGEPARSRRRFRARVLGLALLTLLTGCAYFNTFYFARKYYDQAETLRESSSTDKLPVDAIRKYEKAILQCKKVLNFHADSRWVDDALFLMGASYYGKAEYDSALRTFDGLLEGFPESDFLARAHYYKGLCFYEEGRFGQMQTAFNTAMEIDPEFEYRDDILFTLARTAEEEGDRDEAIVEYRRLIGMFPGKGRAEDALLEIGRLYYDGGIFDSALVAYEGLAETTKDEERFQQATLARARSLIRLGRADEAIDHLVRYLPSRQQIQAERGNEWPAQVKLALAQAYNAQDRHEEAIEELREVIEFYKASPYATEAQYQIGYTYESYMDSLQAAETAYDDATRLSSQSSFRDLARTRLANVRKLISLSSEVTPSGDKDSDRKGEAALEIAELYYFAERKIDEALEQYERVIEEFGDTPSGPKAAYAIGWIHLKDKEDPVAAEQAFREVVFEFPASDQARKAIDLLIEEDADTTGLRAALVEPAPPEPEGSPADSLDAASDSLGLVADSLGLGADSLRAVMDSLGALPDSLLSRVGRDSPMSRRDSLRAAREEALSIRADSLRRSLDPSSPDSSGAAVRREVEFQRSRPTVPLKPPRPEAPDTTATKGVKDTP